MQINPAIITSQLQPKDTLLPGQQAATTLPLPDDTTTAIGAGGVEPGPTIREAFDDFVGQSFYGQLIGSMRKTVGKPAYMHGGRAEEVFQAQLDQQLAEHMSNATADSFTGPMFDLFSLPRS